jgi:RND superfamily putative drug exporter
VFGSIGRFAYRRRVVVALAWVVVLGVGLAIGPRVFSHLGGGGGLRDDAESVVAYQQLARVADSGLEVRAIVDGRDVRDPALRSSVAAAVRDLRALPAVRRVVDPLAAPATGTPDSSPRVSSRTVATDGRAVLLRVELRDDLRAGSYRNAVEAIRARLRAIDAPRVLPEPEDIGQEFRDQAERDLRRGEAVALPVVVVLLALIFRGIVALLLPLAVALVAIAGTLLILLGVGQVSELSSYSVNVVTMAGLGLAVDYSLLLVSRFREERAAGLASAEAIERTLASAGRTVAFSGLTVAVSLAGLLVFAEPLLHSLAWSGIGVVLVAVAAALSLIPALLGLWGRRIRPSRRGRSDRGLFYRQSRLVQRFAVVLVPLLVAGLVLLALPFGHARLEDSGPETLPRSSPARQFLETLRARFPGGGTDPIIVVGEIDPRSPQARALAARIQALPGVVAVAPHAGVRAAVTVLDVVPEGPSEGPVATRLVRDIRGLKGPLALAVTGSAAFLVDYRDSLASRLPLALALIGGATMLLLWLMTGSVAVPLKAIVMNVLSLSASFGALVWVFQEGHLSGVLGFEPAGMVDITVPLLVFVFAFGLSMDYEVFLLSRIKEAWDQTGDNDRAVALGLQRTGRIVTSAAALMVVVFLGFAAGELLTIKEIGVGMAIAIVLDATVVRTLLVPATMKLMGRWNWWAPAWLRRLHQRIGLHEQRAPATLSPQAAPPAGLR